MAGLLFELEEVDLGLFRITRIIVELRFFRGTKV